MTMALRKPTVEPNDPRLKDHQTVYSSRQGAWVKPTPKPTPGTPKKG